VPADRLIATRSYESADKKLGVRVYNPFELPAPSAPKAQLPYWVPFLGH
jgi:hypothetical protein